MTRLLLVVEDRFAIAGRDVLVVPMLDVGEARRDRFHVELRLPDGSRRRVEAFAQVPFFHPTPKVHRTQVALLGITKDDVPIGTEVWTVDSTG